jgi:Flp pilus assembly protein CpaB
MPESKKLIQLFMSGLLALLFVQFYLKSREQNIELGFGMQEVIVSATDIPANQAVTMDMLTTRAVAGRDVEPGAFRAKIPGEGEKRIIGKVTMSAIQAGAQIVNTNLVAPNARQTGVSPMLSPGKRGYVLRLGNLDVAKLIVPGDHIDILATFSVRQKGEDNPAKQTYTILQNILVAAVDKDIMQAGHDVTGKEQTTEGRLLTLMVDPMQAEKLAHATIESGNEISIVVRAHGDEEHQLLTPVSASNLLERTVPGKTSGAGR